MQRPAGPGDPPADDGSAQLLAPAQLPPQHALLPVQPQLPGGRHQAGIAAVCHQIDGLLAAEGHICLPAAVRIPGQPEAPSLRAVLPLLRLPPAHCQRIAPVGPACARLLIGAQRAGSARGRGVVGAAARAAAAPRLLPLVAAPGVRLGPLLRQPARLISLGRCQQGAAGLRSGV